MQSLVGDYGEYSSVVYTYWL